MAVGLLIAFSSKIIFLGLARIVGIETIVGNQNIVYQPDGSYVFTNPVAVAKWIGSVTMIGLIITVVGIWFSGIRIKFPKNNDKTLN
jgi:hypothetical protein